MTGPTPAIRQAARVEVMRLEDLDDLVIAAGWGEAHGLSSHVAAGRVLILWDDSTHITATLGQWLTYDPESGEFAVYDDDKYREQHARVVEVGLQ